MVKIQGISYLLGRWFLLPEWLRSFALGGLVFGLGSGILYFLIFLGWSESASFWTELIITLQAKFILDVFFAFENGRAKTPLKWLLSWGGYHVVRLPILWLESLSFTILRQADVHLLVASGLPILGGFVFYYLLMKRLLNVIHRP